jgi:hypothetical protein
MIDRGPDEEEDLLVANPNHRRDSDESEDEDVDAPEPSDEDARPQEPEDDVEKLSRNIHTLAVVPD